MNLQTLRHKKTLITLAFAAVLVFGAFAPIYAHAQDTVSSQQVAQTAYTKAPGGTEIPPSGCVYYDPRTWPGCMWDWAATLVGIMLVSATAYFSIIVGQIFDWLFYYVVIDFPGLLSTLGFQDGVTLAWSVFRDLANIMMIGVLVYIAINIILGAQKFGDKKLIANVLIIATLINFSLFFSHIVIDASNLAATQFYKSITSVAGQDNQYPIISIGSGSKPSVVQGFLNKMGFAGIFDTSSTLNALREGGKGGTYILIYSFVASVLLVALTGVLLYATFLLLSRAILLIAIMITASVAFASYMVPAWKGAKYGWDVWWRTLIEASLFGPILTLFLWVSMVLISKAKSVGTIGNAVGSTMGSAASGTASNWAPIVLFAFTIGFLYISVKIASNFAGGMTGFKEASFLPGRAFGLGMRASGAVGRQTFGRFGDRLGGYFQDWGKKQQDRGNTTRAWLLDIASRGAKGAGKRDFNVGNTLLGKEIRGLTGLKDAAGGETKFGGFMESEKRRIASHADRAERLSRNEGEKKDVIAKAIKEAAQEPGSDQAMLAGMKQIAEANKTRTDRDAGANKDAINSRYDSEIKSLREQLARTGNQAVKNQIEAKETQRKTELDAETERIKRAQDQIESITTRQTELAKAGLGQDFDKSTKDRAFKIANSRWADTLQRAAGKVGSTTVLNMTLGTTPDNDKLAKAVSKQIESRMKKKEKKEKLGDTLKDLVEDEKKDAEKK